MTNTKFIVGERVVWMKRMAGGNYVFTVQAVVIAVTDKRIKIEADDGRIVVRYVPAEVSVDPNFMLWEQRSP